MDSVRRGRHGSRRPIAGPAAPGPAAIEILNSHFAAPNTLHDLPPHIIYMYSTLYLGSLVASFFRDLMHHAAMPHNEGQ